MGGRPDRAFSASEPLLPETIQFIKESLERDGSVHFELPHVFVVFGASVWIHSIIDFCIQYPTFDQGDLAKKKIFPTLWWLFRDGLLPRGSRFQIFKY
jgi:glucose-6-phosphate 1-dehydrogenase